MMKKAIGIICALTLIATIGYLMWIDRHGLGGTCFILMVFATIVAGAVWGLSKTKK